MELKEEIIEYIKNNRVSTTEVADCLGKKGVLPGVRAVNRRHFAVGEVCYVYAIENSNWSIHEELDRLQPSGKVIFADALDVTENRALFGDLVSKYIMLYLSNLAIVTNGYLRDAHTLIKENYPIWCAGTSPVGCFNTCVNYEKKKREIENGKAKYDGSIMVCDDSGVVMIPKELINEEFIEKLHFIEQQEDTWYDCIDRRKWSTFRTVCLKEYEKVL